MIGPDPSNLPFLEAFYRAKAMGDILEVIYPDGVPEEFTKANRDAIEKIAAERNQTLDELVEDLLKRRDEAERQWRKEVDDFRKEWDALDDVDDDEE